MPCADVNDMEATSSNLNHVYFFVDEAAGAKADLNERGVASTSKGSTQDRSRMSSPGSNEAGSVNVVATSGLNPLAGVFMPHSQPSTATASLVATALYEQRKTPDRGVGLFATHFIKRGTLIICEIPLLEVFQDGVHQVWGPYCRLGNAEKATYDNLHAYRPAHQDFEEASRLYLIDRNDNSLDEDDIEELVADQVRVMSIFSTNDFVLKSPPGLAVLAIASRLNHSCVPNVHHSYNPTLKSITVYAVRDISPSEELLTTYLGAEGIYQPRQLRVRKLRSAYGFTCQCVACLDHTGESEHRRELMSNIAWGLSQFEMQGCNSAYSQPFIPTHPHAALCQAEDLITLMMQEGIYTVELTKAYRVASMHALAIKDFDRALEYAHNEAEVERNCMGDVLDDLRRLGAAAECWIERVEGVIKAEKRGSPKKSPKKWKRKTWKNASKDGRVETKEIQGQSRKNANASVRNGMALE